MKIAVIFLISLFYGGMCWAQENRIAQKPPDSLILDYLSETGRFATLYNGKSEIPYTLRFENHPYFESERFAQGTLSYNHVVYQDVFLRLDLFRNELAVYLPGTSYNIVLENEKFDYAVLNNATLVLTVSENDTKERFLVLLHDGTYPVIKKYKLSINEDMSYLSRSLKRSFIIKSQYAIYVNGVPCPVKNKSSILKLFPDSKKELNEFAKRQKLNFRGQFEQAMIALVTHYEELTSRRHADDAD